MARYLSITFDDGLYLGATKAIRRLERCGLRGCFYLVTGWVDRSRLRTRDPYNAGRDHGTWDDWRCVYRAGHDIGSHTVSHLDALGWRARWVPGLLEHELRQSFDELSQRLGVEPASIAMPHWHASAQSDRIVREIYRMCRLGASKPIYNDLGSIDWWRLACWGPDSDVRVKDMGRVIDEIPDNHWLLLNFHILDDEGWMPISSAAFGELTQWIARDVSLKVVTPAEMARLHRRTERPLAAAASPGGD